jgi:RNA polymerase sigma-70 factor, ECF subfamily
VAPVSQSVSDEELARQSQGGSLAAFEELVYRYEGRIYGFVASCCRNAETSREVTQETLVKAFQALAQYDSRRPFVAWLFTIARRKLIDHQRAMPLVTDEPVPESADSNDPAELLAQREDRQSVWAFARRHLPPAQFQALWLRYAEDLNIADIARALGKTRVHVKVLLFRARQALAAKLDPHGPSGGYDAVGFQGERPGTGPPPAAAKGLFNSAAPL